MSKKLPEDRCDRCRYQRNNTWCAMDERAVNTRKEKLPYFAQIYDFESLARFRLRSLDGRCPHFEERTLWDKLLPVAVAAFFGGMAAAIAAAAYCLVTA